MMKVASQRFSTRAGFRPISPILSKWFPDSSGPRASVDRIDVDLYTFSMIVSKFEGWNGQPRWHLASWHHCVELSWLTECLTGTFWLTDLDKAFKTGTVPAKTGRMVCLGTRVWESLLTGTVFN